MVRNPSSAQQTPTTNFRSILPEGAHAKITRNSLSFKHLKNKSRFINASMQITIHGWKVFCNCKILHPNLLLYFGHLLISGEISKNRCSEKREVKG